MILVNGYVPEIFIEAFVHTHVLDRGVDDPKVVGVLDNLLHVYDHGVNALRADQLLILATLEILCHFQYIIQIIQSFRNLLDHLKLTLLRLKQPVYLVFEFC